jgi:hypothetical protein
MASSSKRRTVRPTVRPRRQRTAHEREQLGKDMVSRKRAAPPPLAQILLLVEQEDLQWLDATLGQLKPRRRRVSRNALLRLGIVLLKEKNIDDLDTMLRTVP